jgi:hypothetical protein
MSSRLMQRDLIVRQRDERDRRSYIVRITDEGLRLADAAPSLLRDKFRAELASLAEWEQTQMLATLQRIATMMSAADVVEEPFLVHEPSPAGATADQGDVPPSGEAIDTVPTV